MSVDAVLGARPLPLVPMGLLDECGHLATAALVLRAGASWRTLRRHRLTVLSALAGSVLIDADHIPLYAGVPHISADGRPYSHSLATVAILLIASILPPRRRTALRSALRGAALGASLHFVRDVATGPGLPLWWPLSTTNILLGYRVYLAAVLVLTAVGTARALAELSAWRVADSGHDGGEAVERLSAPGESDPADRR